MASALLDISCTHHNLISGICGAGKLAGTLPMTEMTVLLSAPGMVHPK